MIADDGTRLEWLGSTLKYQRYRLCLRHHPSVDSVPDIKAQGVALGLGPMSVSGHSRPGRASDRSGHFRCTLIATDLCGTAEIRYVPKGDIRQL